MCFFRKGISLYYKYYIYHPKSGRSSNNRLGAVNARTVFLFWRIDLFSIIVFAARSPPAAIRSGVSALRQTGKAIEESACDMGAGSSKVFMTVALEGMDGGYAALNVEGYTAPAPAKAGMSQGPRCASVRGLTSVEQKDTIPPYGKLLETIGERTGNRLLEQVAGGYNNLHTPKRRGEGGTRAGGICRGR